MGPVFGIKGGATGGGYSQVVPMAKQNKAITSLAELIENLSTLFPKLTNLKALSYSNGWR